MYKRQAWNNAILAAVGDYVTTPDTDKLQSALVAAAAAHFALPAH